jgi:hypothetical protein
MPQAEARPLCTTTPKSLHHRKNCLIRFYFDRGADFATGAPFTKRSQQKFVPRLTLSRNACPKPIKHQSGVCGIRSICAHRVCELPPAPIANSSGAFPIILVRKVADIYLAPEMKAAVSDTTAARVPETGAAIQLTEQQLLAVAGLYWNRDYDQFFKIYMKDSALHISSAGEADSILKPVTETSFHPTDLPYGEQIAITFEPAAQDKPRRLLEKFEDEKPDVYESVEAFARSTTPLATIPANTSARKSIPSIASFCKMVNSCLRG